MKAVIKTRSGKEFEFNNLMDAANSGKAEKGDTIYLDYEGETSFTYPVTNAMFNKIKKSEFIKIN